MWDVGGGEGEGNSMKSLGWIEASTHPHSFIFVHLIFPLIFIFG